MIKVNGKSYTGNNVSIINNEVFIDGKKAEQSEDTKVINITVDANIEKLDVDYCDKLEINGDCRNVISKNGNLEIKGNVTGDVTNKNGNVICREVGGDVATKNGNVTQL